MSLKSKQVKAKDEDTRGCRGCFGWFFRLFKRMKRGCRPKQKDIEPTLTPLATDTEATEEKETAVTVAEVHEAPVMEEENDAAATAEDDGEVRQAALGDAEVAEQEPEVVKTWAEEVDEAEAKGLDVFAPLTSPLLHTAAVLCHTKMTATQRRRARRKALAAAAMKASAEANSASQDSHARTAAAAETSQPADTSEQQQPQAHDKAPVWPAPSLGALRTDGRPFLPKAAATHGGTSATRRRRARRKAVAARLRSESRLAPTA